MEKVNNVFNLKLFFFKLLDLTDESLDAVFMSQ